MVPPSLRAEFTGAGSPRRRTTRRRVRRTPDQVNPARVLSMRRRTIGEQQGHGPQAVSWPAWRSTPGACSRIVSSGTVAGSSSESNRRPCPCRPGRRRAWASQLDDDGGRWFGTCVLRWWPVGPPWDRARVRRRRTGSLTWTDRSSMDLPAPWLRAAAVAASSVSSPASVAGLAGGGIAPHGQARLPRATVTKGLAMATGMTTATATTRVPPVARRAIRAKATRCAARGCVCEPSGPGAAYRCTAAKTEPPAECEGECPEEAVTVQPGRGYRAEADCAYDEGADETTCSCTASAAEGGGEITAVRVPVYAAGALVVGGEVELDCAGMSAWPHTHPRAPRSRWCSWVTWRPKHRPPGGARRGVSSSPRPARCWWRRRRTTCRTLPGRWSSTPAPARGRPGNRTRPTGIGLLCASARSGVRVGARRRASGRRRQADEPRRRGPLRAVAERRLPAVQLRRGAVPRRVRQRRRAGRGRRRGRPPHPGLGLLLRGGNGIGPDGHGRRGYCGASYPASAFPPVQRQTPLSGWSPSSRRVG